MNNINYFERREKIKELFGSDFYEKYPLSSRILDGYIRCGIHCEHREANEVIRGYQYNKGLVGAAKSLAYLPLFLLDLLTSKFKENNWEKILVSPLALSRFKLLEERLKDKGNVFAVLNKRFSVQLLRLGIKNFVNTDKITYNKKLQKLLPEIAIFISKYINNGNDFNKKALFQKLGVLENILSEEVDKLSKIFANKKIKLYLSAFDQVYDDIFNILACQKAGIKTKCIAHAFFPGDIKLESKINCLPVLADKLYLWSQEDYDLLKGYEEIEKIEVGGYPKFDKEYIEKKRKECPEKKIITLFSGYRFSDEWLKITSPIVEKLFYSLKKIAESHGYKIYVRYCDKNEEKMRRGEGRLLKKCHIKISRNPFIKDILQSEISLGFDTSCLYEAKIMGKRAYTLFTHSKYDKIFFMKNIEYIEAEDIEKKLNEKIDFKPRYDLLLNLDYIINNS